MPSLRDLQQRFADAVFAASGMSMSFVAGGPAQAGERIAIYRDTIHANYRKALSATYPVVKRLVGAPFFHAAVDAYAVTIPSTCGDLNVYGDRFGEFVARYSPATDLPYLPDVARLEWAIDEAHRAPDAPRAPEAVLVALSVAPSDRLTALCLRLEPSCRLTASPYPILRIWQTNQPDFAGNDRVALDEGGDVLLIRRDAHGISVERLPLGDHAWLVALAAGASLGAAIEAAQDADATFDLGAALRAHVLAGTISAVVDG